MPQKLVLLKKVIKPFALYMLILLPITFAINILARHYVNNNIELQKEEVELVYNDILKTLIEEEFNPTILPNYKDLSPQSQVTFLRNYFSNNIFFSKQSINGKVFFTTFNLQDFLKKLAKNNIRFSIYLENTGLVNHNDDLPNINSQYIKLSNGLKFKSQLNVNSYLFTSCESRLQKQIFWLNIFTILIFISITIVLIIRKYNAIDFKDRIFNLEQKLFNEIKAKEAILSFNKVNMLYTINCYDKSKETLGEYKLTKGANGLINQSEYLPLPLDTNIRDYCNNHYIIELEPLIKILINYFEGYKILSNTMIELTIKKSVSKFCSPYNKELFYQIIISFFCNILYFHKDTKNKRNIKMVFNECLVSCSSNGVFLENDLAIKYSQKIFYETGNLFILSLGQIFILLNKCGLEYKVLNEAQGTKIELTFKVKNTKRKLHTKAKDNNIINFMHVKQKERN